MDIATQALEVLGLLAVLSSVAVAFVQLLQWVAGKKDNKVKLGAQLLVCFGISYFATLPGFRFIGAASYADTVASISALFWWLSLAFMIDAGIRKFVWQGLMSEHGASHVPKLIRDLVALLLYAAAVMIVMHFVYGEPIAAVLATSGGVAFVIGFAGQKTLAEAFAGLSLSLSKTLKVGDYLEVNGVYGRVHEMNWRSVSLHNPHTDSLYIFPNSAVAGSTVLNYCTPSERFKNTVSFKVEMHAPPELVMRSVTDELLRSRYVFQEPKPDIHVLEFNDYGMTYRIRYFFDGDDPWWEAQNEVVNAIWNAMKRHGFRFAVNRNHLMSDLEWDMPAQPNAIRLSETELAHTLQQHPLFEFVDLEALKIIASKADYSEWLPPECIYQQGDEAHSLVLITEGKCDLYARDGDGEYKLGSVSNGEVMGVPDRRNGAMHYSQTLQPHQFCVGYNISYKLLLELLGEEVLDEAFDNYFEQQQQQQSTQLQEAKQAELAQQRSHKHLQLTQSLKQHLSHYYRDGLASHIWTSVFPHPKEAKLLDALSSSCALIVSDDQQLSEAELVYFCDLAEHIGSLKHINHQQIVDDFEKHFTAAVQDRACTTKKVLSLLNEYADDPDAAKVIMNSCIAISGIHGHASAEQDELLSTISNALNVTREL